VDEIQVRRFSDLTGYVSTKRPGDIITVTYERDGERNSTDVKLKERQSLIVPVMGLRVKNLSQEDKKTFKTDKGVKITGVPETYRGYGIEGKVILAIDDQEISDIEDARILFGNISRYGKTSITMINEKGEKERLIFQ
jgi:S1-C subfamily serine protease